MMDVIIKYYDNDIDDSAFTCSSAAAVYPMDYRTLIYMSLADGKTTEVWVLRKTKMRHCRREGCVSDVTT